MQDVEPVEEYILVIDADMIFRSPFIPMEMGVSPGEQTLCLSEKHGCI